MNIEQAKFCAKFDAETTKILFPSFNVDNFEVMKEWSEGASVGLYQKHKATKKQDINFNGNKRYYKILPEAHIVNGVECPAPLRVKPEIRDYYFVVNEFREAECRQWNFSPRDHRLLEIGNCFKAKEHAEENAKAHYPSLRGEE